MAVKQYPKLLSSSQTAQLSLDYVTRRHAIYFSLNDKKFCDRWRIIACFFVHISYELLSYLIEGRKNVEVPKNFFR